jgi:hypothetical protein
MKYLFRPDPIKGTHVRLSDNVRGNLMSFPDTVTVEPVTALVDAGDYGEHAEPAPPPPPPVIPFEIANWRARAVLEIAGLLPTVETALEAIAGEAGIVARAAWSQGAPFVRSGATVAALSAALGLTSEQVDAMFLQAAGLTV